MLAIDVALYIGKVAPAVRAEASIGSFFHLAYLIQGTIQLFL
ncbi:unnamed protein product, partial [marine sediment metagenome]